MKTNKSKLSKAAQGAEASDKVKALAGKKDEKLQPMAKAPAEIVKSGNITISLDVRGDGKLDYKYNAHHLDSFHQIGALKYALDTVVKQMQDAGKQG